MTTTKEPMHQPEPAIQQVVSDMEHQHPVNVPETEPSAHTEEAGTVHLPDPSICPFIIAVGITVTLTGLLIGVAQILVGVLILAAGIGGWVYQDVQVARRGEHH